MVQNILEGDNAMHVNMLHPFHPSFDLVKGVNFKASHYALFAALC